MILWAVKYKDGRYRTHHNSFVMPALYISEAVAKRYAKGSEVVAIELKEVEVEDIRG